MGAGTREQYDSSGIIQSYKLVVLHPLLFPLPSSFPDSQRALVSKILFLKGLTSCQESQETNVSPLHTVASFIPGEISCLAYHFYPWEQLGSFTSHI
jgi:hypothetical protein